MKYCNAFSETLDFNGISLYNSFGFTVDFWKDFFLCFMSLKKYLKVKDRAGLWFYLQLQSVFFKDLIHNFSFIHILLLLWDSHDKDNHLIYNKLLRLRIN
jgi:hypothetical protein